MSAGVYANINGVTRKGKKLYAKVNGVVRPIKEMWVRDNGVSRRIYNAIKGTASIDDSCSGSSIESHIYGDGSALIYLSAIMHADSYVDCKYVLNKPIAVSEGDDFKFTISDCNVMMPTNLEFILYNTFYLLDFTIDIDKNTPNSNGDYIKTISTGGFTYNYDTFHLRIMGHFPNDEDYYCNFRLKNITIGGHKIDDVQVIPWTDQ